MEIRYYWEIVKKWLWLIIIGLILGGAGGYFLTQQQTPMYSASTKVMISSPSSSGTMNSMDYYFMYNQEQLVQTYLQILGTQPTVDQISEQLGYDVFKGQINGSLIQNTRIFQVNVTHMDPQKAAEIANAAVDFLITYNNNLQTEQFSTSEDSLQAQISQVEAQISTNQLEIAELEGEMSSESSENISGQIANIQTQMSRLETLIIPQQTELVSLQKQLAVLEEKNIYTGDQIGTPEEIEPLNEDIFQLQFELDENTAELSYYRSKYYTLLDREINPAIGNTESSYQLQQLKSNLALYQQMYTSLVANYENVRLERLRNTPIIVQVEAAITPLGPISPSLINNVGLGAALGLMLAGGTVFLIEYLNDKVQLPEQVAVICDLPVIGVISELPKQYRETVMMHEKPRSPIVESFRILRNNIELSKGEKGIHSLLIISPNPGDGKSTVATNLATAYSQQGRNTLLIDADLRRPRVHKLFHLENRFGLSDMLRNGINKEAPTEFGQVIGKNLTVITSGSLSDENPDMIADQAPVFVPQLAEFADRVIFDCPPILFSESFSLAKEVDGIIIIIKPGVTKIKSLKRLLEQMDWIGANVIGLLFNQVSEKKHGYYYEHYYSTYSYQYRNKYHSYYNEVEETPKKS